MLGLVSSVGSSSFLRCLVWLRALPGAASCVVLSGLLDCTIWLPALLGLASSVVWSGFLRCLFWLRALPGFLRCLIWLPALPGLPSSPRVVNHVGKIGKSKSHSPSPDSMTVRELKKKNDTLELNMKRVRSLPRAVVFAFVFDRLAFLLYLFPDYGLFLVLLGLDFCLFVVVDLLYGGLAVPEEDGVAYGGIELQVDL